MVKTPFLFLMRGSANCFAGRPSPSWPGRVSLLLSANNLLLAVAAGTVTVQCGQCSGYSTVQRGDCVSLPPPACRAPVCRNNIYCTATQPGLTWRLLLAFSAGRYIQHIDRRQVTGVSESDLPAGTFWRVAARVGLRRLRK